MIKIVVSLIFLITVTNGLGMDKKQIRKEAVEHLIDNQKLCLNLVKQAEKPWEKTVYDYQNARDTIIPAIINRGAYHSSPIGDGGRELADYADIVKKPVQFSWWNHLDPVRRAQIKNMKRDSPQAHRLYNKLREVHNRFAIGDVSDKEKRTTGFVNLRGDLHGDNPIPTHENPELHPLFDVKGREWVENLPISERPWDMDDVSWFDGVADPYLDKKYGRFGLNTGVEFLHMTRRLKDIRDQIVWEEMRKLEEGEKVPEHLMPVIQTIAGETGLKDIYPEEPTQQLQQSQQQTPHPGNQPDFEIYIVQAGDTLSEIARKYGIDLQVLAEYNGIENPNKIYKDQEIRIPINR